MNNIYTNIVVIAQDLFFLPRIQNIAKPYGYNVVRTADLESFKKTYLEENFCLILIDLEGSPEVWKKILAFLSNQINELNIIGYGHHSDKNMLAKAEKLGCDIALTKAQFSRDLIEIVRSQGQSAIKDRNVKTKNL